MEEKNNISNLIFIAKAHKMERNLGLIFKTITLKENLACFLNNKIDMNIRICIYIKEEEFKDFM